MPIGADIKPEINPKIILKCNLNLFLLVFCSLEFISKYVPKINTTIVKKIINDFVFINAANVVPNITPIITNNP